MLKMFEYDNGLSMRLKMMEIAREQSDTVEYLSICFGDTVSSDFHRNSSHFHPCLRPTIALFAFIVSSDFEDFNHRILQ